MLCFIEFLVAKKFMDKKAGEYQDFPSKIFCPTFPKKFIGEPFSVSINLGIENFLGFRGLSHDFPSKVSCFTAPKHFVEEPVCALFQKISSSEKLHG